MKLIVTDLDGTLLKTDKTISEYTKMVLGKCKECGIKLAYATGRSGRDAIISSGFFDARINMNGAIARVGEDVVYERLISADMVSKFLVSCDKRGLIVASQGESMHYSNFIVSDVWPEVTNFKIVDFYAHKVDAQKIYLIDLKPDDVTFVKDNLPDELYMVMANDGMLMIMHKEATKSKALSAVAEHWGIAPSEIVVFGDDLNDIDMLTFAGVSIAMGNALQEAKTAADIICDTNDNDGVAKWLEENVL